MSGGRRDMTRLDLDEMRSVVAEERYPLIFSTVSGAHLYGFPSQDSDVDLRGVHLLPADEVVGLLHGPDTLDRTWQRDGVEIDLVTHDAAKFFRLMLRPNGYVLEQLLSPLVVTSSSAHAELVALAADCITARHAHHYRGFARGQRDLFARTRAIKPLLYAFRVLLTGIALMRTGRVEAHLPTLLKQGYGAPSYLPDLIAAKSFGEHGSVDTVSGAPDLDTVMADLDRLTVALDEAEAASTLPERPTAHAALHDFLVRLRLNLPD